MKSEIEIKFLELLRKPVKSKEEIEELENVKNELHAELIKETRILINELKSVGINITSIYDLVNTKASYPNAIPILINQLKKEYNYRNKEGIIRALAVKEAVGKASSALIDEYNRTPKDKMTFRWTIGNSVYVTVTNDDVEKILPIVQDLQNGISRERFVASLGKIKSKKAEDVLIQLLADNEVCLQAMKALAKLRSLKAKEAIISLIDHPDEVIRKEAKKALQKIEKK